MNNRSLNSPLEEDLTWKISSSDSISMVSATLARALHTLLNARPKKLQNAMSQLQSPPKITPFSGASLEQSLWFLHKYVGEAAAKEETLDDALIPMIEHSLKLRESKNNNQAVLLLNWLFQDEVIFLALASNLADTISRKDDKYIALGWCTLVRAIIDYQSSMNKLITNGIRERYPSLLKILSTCITHLLAIVCRGSTSHGGFELPTRLAVAAADCILSITVSLAQMDLTPDYLLDKENSQKSTPVTPLWMGPVVREKCKNRKDSARLDDFEQKLLLWDHIDDHITLVERLRDWSRKSRPLHSIGLKGVFIWLNATKNRHVYFHNEADMQKLKPVVLLLSSCWKHYGLLLHLEGDNFHHHYKDLLDQYLSGIQCYTDNHSEESIVERNGRPETVKFFLNCISLLLGRLDHKHFDIAVAEYGTRLANLLILQLKCADEDMIDSVICIFKALFFRSRPSPLGGSGVDFKQMHAVVYVLLELLDERDAAAKAAVKLVAEYCSLASDDKCIKEILKRLSSGDLSRRLNAADVISDLVVMSVESVTALPDHIWQDIAHCLLECLGDAEVAIRMSVSPTIALIDPPLVLPQLVHLIYSMKEIVRSLARSTLSAILKKHADEPKVVCLLLDCLSGHCQGQDPSGAATDRKGPEFDANEVLKLVPEWSRMVTDWNVMISALLDKLFAEPSSAVMVRCLSYISDHLADHADLVLCQLLLHAEGMGNFQENSELRNLSSQKVDAFYTQHSLFSRLCPLLVIRLLPLKVFDDFSSSSLYGKYSGEHLVPGTVDCSSFAGDAECICALLLNRALSNLEFEDVRKLAAELCGRIHPRVLVPILSAQLGNAVEAEDTMKIKSCLFSLCTSLMIRGMDTYQHPQIISIRKAIETILYWPSMDRDDIMKAQHGCIDCLAWMLCSELDASKDLKSSKSENVSIECSVCTYVISILIGNKYALISSELDGRNRAETARPLSFRLCMANVLISACQKISSSGKKPFARKVLPSVLQAAGVIEEPDMRVAYNQVLFSAVYHLKAVVLPYASDILRVALQSLRDGSEKEKMSGAKIIASLMASEEPIIQKVSKGLLEARTLLTSMASSDSSVEVQQLCRNLLLCLMS